MFEVIRVFWKAIEFYSFLAGFNGFSRVLPPPPLDSGESWRLQNRSILFEKKLKTYVFGPRRLLGPSWGHLEAFFEFS